MLFTDLGDSMEMLMAWLVTQYSSNGSVLNSGIRHPEEGGRCCEPNIVWHVVLYRHHFRIVDISRVVLIIFRYIIYKNSVHFRFCSVALLLLGGTKFRNLGEGKE